MRSFNFSMKVSVFELFVFLFSCSINDVLGISSGISFSIVPGFLSPFCKPTGLGVSVSSCHTLAPVLEVCWVCVLVAHVSVFSALRGICLDHSRYRSCCFWCTRELLDAGAIDVELPLGLVFTPKIDSDECSQTISVSPSWSSATSPSVGGHKASASALLSLPLGHVIPASLLTRAIGAFIMACLWFSLISPHNG